MRKLIAGVAILVALMTFLSFNFALNKVETVSAQNLEIPNTELTYGYIPKTLKLEKIVQFNKDGKTIYKDANGEAFGFQQREKIKIDPEPVGSEMYLSANVSSEDPGKDFKFLTIRKNLPGMTFKPLRREHTGWWMKKVKNKVVDAGPYKVNLRIQEQNDFSGDPTQWHLWIEASWQANGSQYSSFSRNIPEEEVLKIISEVR